MAVTYTPATERDARRASARGTFAPDLRLLAMSALALVAILMAGSGRLRSFEYLAPAPAPQAVNLNTVNDAAEIEAVLMPVFENPADRRFAAREIFGFLVQADGGRRTLANVGALTRITTPVEAIDRGDRLTGYRERLQQARESAAAAGRQPPTVLSVVTSSTLSAIKPAVTVRDAGAYRRALLLWAVIYVAAFHAVSLFWRWRGIAGDRLLLTIIHALTAIGFVAMVGRQDPLRDLMLFERYAAMAAIGALILGAVSALGSRVNALQEFKYLALVAALALSVTLILFGSGPGNSDARVNLGPAQPIEAIRLLLGVFLAGYFARRWELLRGVRTSQIAGRALPRWLNLPRASYVLPVLAGVAASLLLFFFQKDLGPALIIALVFLSLYVVARGSYALAALGLVLLVAGFYLGYQLNISATVVDRIYMWHSPWDNFARRGDQIAQAAWSLAAGGLFGTGLGFGDTRYLPAGETDLIMASVGEELGFIGIVTVLLLYVALVWRALSIARRASGDFLFFLAVAITLLTAMPVVLMLAGTLGAVPLTGVVTPFLSYGGSAMLINCAAMGLLVAIRQSGQPRAELDLFAPPLRVLMIALGTVAAALVAFLFVLQVWRADEILVRPQLGEQADGSRRYQYNPRILDVARGIPRGSLLDRQGLPLASDDRALIDRSAEAYQRLGISLPAVCRDTTDRCYPLGGRAYHVLGDARTRSNWSASNTSFIERDEEAGLRGFNDHQTSVRTASRDGGTTTALRRDYQELVPLFRHRYDREHAAVKAVLDRPRDLKVTIDARLQQQAAGILAAHTMRAGAARAAAVVLDAETGDILASVSYPWPDAQSAAPATEDRLLDRARYGLYPPGSTFKLLTAAAALRQDAALAGATFACVRLPDQRVGAQIPGWRRPVRDDVQDHSPHGVVAMHEGLVVSCNAYFANLAVRLGPQPLIDTAERAEISLARNNAPARVRDTLPLIGYGQGDVLASPLRMARVAAALAGDGSLPDVALTRGQTPGAPRAFVTADAASELARYMRDAVLRGTGRALSGHAARIAGKTGTAEITGAASHSWFVGFAPYGTATRRVAVAVIIENAGYGARAAVPAAGEIMTAAAQLGYVR